jgi:hypothetical protein
MYPKAYTVADAGKDLEGNIYKPGPLYLCEFVRDIVIYVRCDDSMDKAGGDPEPDEREEPGENCEWENVTGLAYFPYFSLSTHISSSPPS